MEMNPHGMTTVVLDVRAMLRGSETGVVERVLGRQDGVHRVEANAVAQTATVSYDPARTSLQQLRQAVEECGYHCAGQSVPLHVCDPAAEPSRPLEATPSASVPDEATHDDPSQVVEHAAHMDHGGHGDHKPHADGPALHSPQDVMGHGGHGGMSMAATPRAGGVQQCLCP